MYESDYLEKREFGVTLKEGMMTAVDIKGSPDRGETAKSVLSPIAGLASSAIGLSAPDEVLWSANPAVKEIVSYGYK